MIQVIATGVMLREINIRINRYGIILLLTIAVHAAAQGNLVANPGFEEYYRCPGSWNYKSHIRNLAPGWWSLSNGTPDLFNGCSTGDTGVPRNFAGVASAHSGSGYAGIFAWLRSRDYREYLHARLVQPLVPHVQYKVSFHFRLAQYSGYSIDRIGVLLSDSIRPVNHDQVLTFAPSFSLVHDSAFHRTSGTWELASTIYTASGNERYITIGNFSKNKDTKFFHINFERPQEPMLKDACYFYIDDVSVEEIASRPVMSPVDTSAVEPDRTYILKNINFEYNKSTLLGTSFSELDKIANLLKSNPQWSIVLTGHTDDQGTDAYNLELSLRRAQRCGEYLVTQGITRKRIQCVGKGKASPLVTGVDELSRSTNRRVEFRVGSKVSNSTN